MCLVDCHPEAHSDRKLSSFEPWNRKVVISWSAWNPWQSEEATGVRSYGNRQVQKIARHVLNNVPRTIYISSEGTNREEA